MPRIRKVANGDTYLSQFDYRSPVSGRALNPESLDRALKAYVKPEIQQAVYREAHNIVANNPRLGSTISSFQLVMRAKRAISCRMKTQ